MTFTTLTFPIFLALVFALHWASRTQKLQNRILLGASYFFYAWWDWRFCFLMLASSLIDFLVAQRISQSPDDSRRKLLLATSILSNLGLLATFKYFDFFIDNLTHISNQIGWSPDLTTLNLVLPLGISFYTFQTLGYTIDVYRKRIQPARKIVDYLAFVSFFPQLVAGPIERAERILPQFAARRTFQFDVACDGTRQILWGFFKKIVIADRLALAVNPVFAEPGNFSGPHLMLSTIFFAFQIYCDFSAYSDIAIGTAKLFGIRLSRNFAYPYFSQSISEFWRRWHISLSMWFRDYVYIPLGGSQCSPARRRLNLAITFVLSGLWHGAAWRFVAWGGLNGLAIALPGHRHSSRTSGRTPESKQLDPISSDSETNREPPKNRSKKTLRVEDVPGGKHFLPRPGTLLRIYSTFAIICAAWIFFRANSFSDAIVIFQQIGRDLFSADAYRDLATTLQLDRYQRKTATMLLMLICWEWVFRRDNHPLQLRGWPTMARWSLYTVLIWSTLYLMPKTGTGEFVYFEF